MLTHLFYLIGVWFVLYELSCILSPNETTQSAKRFRELAIANKGRKWDAFSQEYKDEIKSKFFILIPFAWQFIGLFSSQWVAFLFAIIINIAIVTPISSLSRYNLIYTSIHFIHSIFGFAFGIFVIINHYHMRIDLTQRLFDIIN